MLKHKALPLTLALLLGLSSLAQAQQLGDEDEVEKEWKEVAAQLPPAPKPENLRAFYDSGTQAFAIDLQSISLAADGTVRYTLVATSRTGVKNISYEAIRCASWEKKLYAFGHPDGSWSRSRRNEWQPIMGHAANQQHGTLAQEYFCEGNTVAGKTDAIIKRLKQNQSLAKPY
jgi:hypothetical protein